MPVLWLPGVSEAGSGKWRVGQAATVTVTGDQYIATLWKRWDQGFSSCHWFPPFPGYFLEYTASSSFPSSSSPCSFFLDYHFPCWRPACGRVNGVSGPPRKYAICCIFYLNKTSFLPKQTLGVSMARGKYHFSVLEVVECWVIWAFFDHAAVPWRILFFFFFFALFCTQSV